MKPLHATLLQMYQQCPAKFDFVFNKEFPNVESPALRKGRAFHAFAETYINHLIAIRKTSDRQWIIDNQGNAFEPLTKLDDEEYKDILEIIEGYFGDNFLFEPMSWEHVRAEKKFAFNKEWQLVEIEFEKSIFEGTIDLILYDPDSKRIIIRDYKTDRGLPKQEVVFRSLQVLAYSFAGFTLFPEAQECKFILDYVRFPRASGRSRMVDKGEAMLWPEIVKEYTEKIKAKEFQPRPNPWCFHDDGFCPFLRICPAYKNLNDDIDHDLKLIETDDEAKISAGRMYRLEAALKATRANLRDWTKEHGAVHLSGNEYLGYFEISRKKRNAFAAAEHLRDYNIDIDQIIQLMNIDARKFDKFIKEHQLPELEIKEEIGSEFGEFKQ